VNEDKSIIRPSLSKPSFRMKLHFWLCDLFNLVSFDDFSELVFECSKRINDIDNFIKAQTEFDERIAERLHIGKKFDDSIEKDNDDRGVYQ